MAQSPTRLESRLRADRLTVEVLAGLQQTPKQLSPVWFYDELGSFLFESICELPEYYVTRTELAIMHRHAADMVHHIGPNPAIIEYGSGSSLKTRLLLDKLDMPATYVPVDIAREPLLDAAGSIARDYPELRIVPICADFTHPFDLPVQVSWAARRVVYFPGSTLGNFEAEPARRLLSSMRTLIGRKGAVLIGLDLRKDPRILERAYDDASGVTAEFNLNALRHLNRELGMDFNLSAFEHRAVWVEDESRIEMHLVSKRGQTIHLGEHEIRIERGEYLRTECCHKYTVEGFANLAASADFAVTRVWTDDGQRFSVLLLEPRTLQ
jgi:L-histidine N-alpha-methyltransferase